MLKKHLMKFVRFKFRWRRYFLIEIIDDIHVKVRLEGACTNCGFSMSTMKAGVETTIKIRSPN